MSGTTRGPLPSRVYWGRRLMVLGIAALLVVGIAKMLGGSGGGSGALGATDVAATSPATSPAPGLTTAPTLTDGPSTPSSTSSGQTGQGANAPVTRVSMPSGPCAASDVAVTPSVPKPIAGAPISLVLDISSLTTPACTWTMSPTTTAVKITSGSDVIWTSQQCPKLIPTQSLVLRQSGPTQVRLTWNAERSEPGCPGRTEWALPGTYHLHVAALGGPPQDATFLLVAPSPAQVTRTAHPHNGTGKGNGKGTKSGG